MSDYTSESTMSQSERQHHLKTKKKLTDVGNNYHFSKRSVFRAREYHIHTPLLNSSIS